MTEYLLALPLMLVGFVTAIAAIPLMVSGIRIINREEGFLPYMFYTSNFINAAAIINSDRNLFVFTEDIELATLPGHLIWLGRINSALIVWASSQRIIHWLYGREQRCSVIFLLAMFLLYFFTNAITAALFSAHPSLKHDYFYLLFAGSAALLFRPGEEAIAIRAARNAYFILLLVSASFLLWKPQMVASSNYVVGLIPGLTYRYAGVAPHANSLGMMIDLFLVCLAHKPFERSELNTFAWFIGLVSLIACQSKTNWIAILVILPSIGYFKYRSVLKHYLFNFRQPLLPALGLISSMILLLGSAGILMFGELGSQLNALLATKAGSELLTLSGRDLIWNVALNEWRSSPLFGYGLTLWDEAHRAKIGLPAAVSAHSQFYQSLASSGLVGVVGLGLYVTVLCWYAVRVAQLSEGLSLALFSMIIFRAISETPLTPIGHFHADGLTHVLLLMVISTHFQTIQVSKTTKAPINYSIPQKA